MKWGICFIGEAWKAHEEEEEWEDRLTDSKDYLFFS